uniref:Uncharacterized protein n=1 Tax=Triticum urartu TaxID=4572 RepID=A0A8R7RB58_TRIUA
CCRRKYSPTCSAASRRAALPCAAAPARPCSPSSTPAACCAGTSSRSPSAAYSSISTANVCRSSSPVPPPAPPSPAERKDLIEGGEDTEYMEYLKENKLELNSGKEQLVEEKFEWDSENDNILHKEDVVDARGNGYFDILGFHPYKEIAFLGVSMYRGIAYHLKYSKVQDLGYLYPTT